VFHISLKVTLRVNLMKNVTEGKKDHSRNFVTQWGRQVAITGFGVTLADDSGWKNITSN